MVSDEEPGAGTSSGASRSAAGLALSLLATALIGAAQALVLAFVAGSGPDTDAFFAAYALYLPLAVLASSLRASVVPLIEFDAQSDTMTDRSRQAVSESSAFFLACCCAGAAASPLLVSVVASGLPAQNRHQFVVSALLLAAASYLHAHASLLSAVLTARREFAFSSVMYPGCGAVGLAVSALLVWQIGVVGAAVGVLTGTCLLAGAHSLRVHRVRGLVLPFGGLRAPGASLRRGWYLLGNAALGWATQLGLVVAMAALSGATGELTAYTYAFFTVLLMLNVTSLPIGLVRLPDLVSTARAHGSAGVAEQVLSMATHAFVVLAPLIAVFIAFGEPLLGAVFGASLGGRAVATIYGAGCFLCILTAFSVILQLAHASAMALDRWRASLAANAVGVGIHIVILAPLSGSSPATVAAGHATAAATTACLLAAVVFRHGAARLLWGVLLTAAPAFALALAVAIPRAFVQGDASLVTAATAAAGGVIAYAGLTRIARPAVSRPYLRLLRPPVAALRR